MKIEVYFEVRWLMGHKEKYAIDREARGDDVVIKFLRTINAPCALVPGQFFFPKTNPFIGSRRFPDSDCTALKVVESGLLEDIDRIRPYFVVSEEIFFPEWIESERRLESLSRSQLEEQWKMFIKSHLEDLEQSFAKEGWTQED